MHFTPVELGKIGSLLMNKRKEQGLLLKHLADEHISASTISSIERGAGNVKPEKIRYYATKLGVDLDHLPKLVERFEETQQEIKRKLDLIDASIDLVGPDHALQKLKAFDISCANETLKAFYLYLHGRCYMHKKHWEKARKYFKDVLHLYNNHPSLEQDKSNIKSACLKELGRICYYLDNDIKQALAYTNEGLKVFCPNGERTQIRYSMLVGRVIYNERLNKIEEAHRTLEQLWTEMEHIQNVEIILNMYELRANILIQLELFHEAKNVALEGLEIARINKQYDPALELLVALGKAYIQLKDLKKAEEYLLTCLDLREHLKFKYLLIKPLTQLGKIYIQQKKWDRAIKSLEEAIEFGKNNKKLHYTIEAFITLGDYYLQQQKYEEAVIPYQKALDLSNENEFNEHQHELYLKLGQCYETFDKKKFIECIQNLFYHEVKYYAK